MFSYVREITTIWTIYKIALNALGMIGVDLILLLVGRAHNVFICWRGDYSLDYNLQAKTFKRNKLFC